MAEAGVDAFLVPRADAHQGENVAPRDERLAWLTGFTGSAGLAVVTRDRAAVFVDGRYRLQVRGEVDLDAFEVRRHPEDKPGDWLIEALPGGGRARLRPLAAHRRRTSRRSPRRSARGRSRSCASRTSSTAPGPTSRRRRRGRSCRTRTSSPAAARPRSAPSSPAASPRRDLAAAVLTLPDSIAWLLNVRGSDIARTPVPLAFAILGADARVALFTEPAQARRAGARPPRRRGHGRRAGGLRPGARRACAAGWRSTGRPRRSGSPTGWRRPGPRWSGSATPASCRRRRRTRPSSPASGRRTCATARRSRPSSPGSTRRRPRAG